MPTRRWWVNADDAVYDVEARVGQWSGDVRVFVNHAEVRRGPRWRDTTRRLTFPLGRHIATVLWIRQGRYDTRFDLVLDGRSVATGGQPRPPAADDSAGLALGVVMAFAILAAVLWIGAVPEIRLASEGREVSAHVTGGHVARGRSLTYYLSYVFVTADGGIRRAEGIVSAESYRSVRPGDAIAVVYVPTAPEIQRPASHDERAWIAGLAGMFAVMLLAGAWALWRAYRLREISKAVAERGVRAAAVIDNVSKGWRIGPGLSRIRYHYEDAEGRRHDGISSTLYIEEASAYGPGSSATVAYDPNRPGDSMWIGAADPKATVWVPAAG